MNGAYYDPRRRHLSARQGRLPARRRHADTPGYRDFRGSIETTGQFALNNKWTWGWDGIVPTDQTFFQNYRPSTYQRGSNDPGRTA